MIARTQRALALILLLSLALASVAVIPASPVAAAPARQAATQPLSLETLVACQEAVEGVYWRHREWPDANVLAKPGLAEVLPRTALQSQVLDTLRLSVALEDLWNRPVTADQLQAEMDRMAADSRDPARLSELFAALGNDPVLIAECLARPALVSRLARNWYASDQRFHGDLRAQAVASLEGVSNDRAFDSLGGQYIEVDIARDSDPAAALGGADWDTEVARLAAIFDVAPDRLPVNQPSPLQEDADSFYAVTVLSQAAEHLTVATVSWQKTPFDRWWQDEAANHRATVPGVAGAFRLPDLPAAPASADFWLPTQSLPERTDGTVIWTGSEMIVWGGGDVTSDASKWNTGSRYNPATDTWTTMTTQNAPLERGLHSAIWTGSEMIVWGGCGPFDQDFCALNDGARYNPAADVWTDVSDIGAPSTRLRHTAVWTGSEMFIWGGCAYSTSGTVCHIRNDAKRYDPTADAWNSVSSTGAPPAAGSRKGVWTGDQVIIWNGAGFGGGLYDPASDSWTPMSSANEPPVNNSFSVIWTGQEMIAWGGCSGNCAFGADGENVGARYDPDLDTWTATSVAGAPAPRYLHTAVWTGSEMIVWGGVSSEQSLADTGGRYDPASDTWTGATSTVNAPTGRARHHAVWTGDEMIVWGRFTTDASGGRYDPASNSWTATNANDPQRVLAGHAAAWTGSEMLVWGSIGTLGPANTGDRYNPATDVWTPMNSSHGLGTRSNFASVWTGNELIIWGGSMGGNLAGNGARYSATADTWSPISAVDAPSARSLHSAVWTGSEMIVWGGQEFNGNTATGARYDPASDDWTTISAVAAPAARRQHSAVWADGAMIVWGGVAGALGENTGGRYDPASDSWTQTSTANAPSGRYRHTATWTGDEMIVFGGLSGPVNNAIFVNSGGRYDPVADAWTATSAVAPPSPRALHTAIWTGSELIIWGGCSGLVCSAVVDTGGRYDPASDGWTATTLDGAPVARAEHSAIWTGDAMIVWGGLTEDGGGIAGGVYRLQTCGAGFDLNCDGVVDVLDITLVANRWGCALGDPCYASRFDLNGDDAITVADVMIVTAAWGSV